MTPAGPAGRRAAAARAGQGVGFHDGSGFPRRRGRMSIKGRLRDMAYKASGIISPRLHSMIVSQRRPDAPVDPRVRYPSYKSLDELLDVEHLQRLDGGLREGIARWLRDGPTEPFDTGELKLRTTAPRKPGSTVIQLSVPVRQDIRYHDLRKCELWRPGPAAEHFPELMDFIATLPFEDTARMIIMCDLEGRAVTAHRDHYASDVLHEFVWFRTTLDKPFFVQSWQTGERLHLSSHTAWFDTVNQYHGADAGRGFCFSMRVDGRFTDAFRDRIPRPPVNAASTPSFWAALEG